MAIAQTIAQDDPASPDAAPRDGVVTAGLPAAEAGGVLTVDLAAIVENWRSLSRKVMPTECAAVIKANAYGCGIEQVAGALARAGCKTFFVADLGEARRVRAVAGEPAIYVLNGLLPDSAAGYAEIRAQPVIGSLLEFAEWDGFCASSGWRGGAALHVDTGMNRLGIALGEASALAPRLRTESHSINLLMTHLACAEVFDHPLNQRQISTFRELRVYYRGIPSSIANSSGIFLGNAAHCDMVRPGVALYGVNPTPGQRNPMRPVVTLQGKIVQLRTVARGETVGYGAAWTARHVIRLAVVAVGYADGFPRAVSAADGAPGGEAIIAGQRCALAGRVSMDLLAVDVTDLPDSDVKRGDLVTLIGGDITVDEVAKIAGTIGYEVLTSLGQRYHRVYREA